MPNHVRNLLTASVSLEQWRKIADDIAILDEKGQPIRGTVDFERIIPMPKTIFRGDLGPEEQKKYGQNNWYDWSLKNWGTKWNAYAFDEDIDGAVRFNTAWDPPLPVIHALSLKYPEVRFQLAYADEALRNNIGMRVYVNGVSTESVEPSNVTEYVELATFIWDRAPEDIGFTLSRTGRSFVYMDDEAFPIVRIGQDDYGLLVSEKMDGDKIPLDLFFTVLDRKKDPLDDLTDHGINERGLITLDRFKHGTKCLSFTGERGTFGDLMRGDIDIVMGRIDRIQKGGREQS